MESQELERLKVRLQKIEDQLSKCRTSTIQDGWQTMRFAKKSRSWDLLAERKVEILTRIWDIDTNFKP